MSVANNRDYSAFRVLAFYPLCRFVSDPIAMKFLVRLNHKLVSFETFSGFFFFFFFFFHGYRVIQISNFCTQTGSMRNG